MTKGIISSERRCFLCGRRTGLELHHIFGSANRKRSDKEGMTVWLCHDHHNEPPNGVHHNVAIDRQLKQYAQKVWQEHYDRTEAEFRAAYGKSYLE